MKKSNLLEIIGIICTIIVAVAAVASFFIAKESYRLSIQAINAANTSNELSNLSIKIAEKNNAIAQEALEATKFFSITTQRPYLEVEPHRFKDTGTYIKIRGDSKRAIINFEYKLENKGDTSAKDIFMFNGAEYGWENPKPMVLSCPMPPPITLVPGQSYFMQIEVAIGMKNPEAITELIESINTGTNSVFMKVVLFYSSELAPTITYRTEVAHKIFKDKAIVLRADAD